MSTNSASNSASLRNHGPEQDLRRLLGWTMGSLATLLNDLSFDKNYSKHGQKASLKNEQ